MAATRKTLKLTALTGLLIGSAVQAAILPEDRADVMYHGYDGGGLQVVGPSILVRKGFKDTVSVWSNYYIDMITSASIDVMASASEYTEQRDEKKYRRRLPARQNLHGIVLHQQ